MTILSIGNPFGNQQQPQQTGGTQPSQGENTNTQNSPDAVEPSQGSSTENSSGQSTSYSGSGAGAGGTGAQSATGTTPPPSRPADASPDSVVSAQTAISASPNETLDRARAAAINLMQIQRADALIEGLKSGPSPIAITPEFSDVQSPAKDQSTQLSSLSPAREEAG